jgi:hypothetical protein
VPESDSSKLLREIKILGLYIDVYVYNISIYVSTYTGTGGTKWIGEMDRQMYTDDLLIHVLMYFCMEFKNSAAATDDRLE